MEIITRIPPAYFIHIEGDNENFSQWINLAHVVTVNRYDDEINIRLIDDRAISLDGEHKDKFLSEISRLNARYRVTVA
jgi:hypothetical protein